MRKPVVLTFVSCYLPGYKFGGPLRTIANMVEHLGDEFDFKIVTRDRDLGDKKPYDNVLINQWQQVGKAQVFYCSSRGFSFTALRRLINNTAFDVLYLNSFFDVKCTLKPLLLVRMRAKNSSTPIILAPRGEFSQGALQLKSIKKRLYIAATGLLKLYENVIWHASTDMERRDIEYQHVLMPRLIHVATICVAKDLSFVNINSGLENHSNISGVLRVLFLSRISPMKNLDYALSVLKKVKVNVRFDIYGPQEDLNYWKTCQSLIQSMPDHVKVNYCGSVHHADVFSIFSQYDLFFLPTRGENYGHVIAESLMAGTPVLISDKTPWQQLANEQLGWEFPLDDDSAFVHCIEKFAAISSREKYDNKMHIRNTIRDKLIESDVFEANRQLFLSCVSG